MCTCLDHLCPPDIDSPIAAHSTVCMFSVSVCVCVCVCVVCGVWCVVCVCGVCVGVKVCPGKCVLVSTVWCV